MHAFLQQLVFCCWPNLIIISRRGTFAFPLFGCAKYLNWKHFVKKVLWKVGFWNPEKAKIFSILNQIKCSCKKHIWWAKMLFCSACQPFINILRFGHMLWLGMIVMWHVHGHASFTLAYDKWKSFLAFAKWTRSCNTHFLVSNWSSNWRLACSDWGYSPLALS